MTPAANVTRDSWKEILASAITIFEDLEAKGFGSPDAVIGGGTVLMFRFEHRLSKDIDFFMHDAQWLSLLTPRLNDTTAMMATHYTEQGSSLKLVLPRGDIDFIVSAAVTDADTNDSIEFMGRTFLLEATEEILAKKLFYRAAQFQPRDVFDFVVAIERHGIGCAGSCGGRRQPRPSYSPLRAIVAAAPGPAGRGHFADWRFFSYRAGNDRDGSRIHAECGGRQYAGQPGSNVEP